MYLNKIKKRFVKDKTFVLLLLILLFINSLVLVQWLSQQQDIRSNASKTTRLFMKPTSSVVNPVQIPVGGRIPVQFIINPGNDLVSYIKFEIKYDNTKLTVSKASDIEINPDAFPNVFEGPILGPGKILGSINIGADPSKAIKTETRVMTITFSAISQTLQSTKIEYGNLTEVLSVDPDLDAHSNVLASTEPLFLSIGLNTGTIFPTISSGTTITPSTITPTSLTPTISTTPSGIVTPTLIPPTLAVTPSITPTENPLRTTFILNLLLHGIGASGDLVNPGGNKYSNKNPIHQERSMNIQLVDENNQTVATKIAPAFYNPDTGVFYSNVIINETLRPGDYVIKVKTDGYLRKLMPGFLTVDPGKKNQTATTFLVAGEINGDNAINMLDYNILYDCGYGNINPLPMINSSSQFLSKSCQSHASKESADLNDNGIVEAGDYNLFIRELSASFGKQ